MNMILTENETDKISNIIDKGFCQVEEHIVKHFAYNKSSSYDEIKEFCKVKFIPLASFLYWIIDNKLYEKDKQQIVDSLNEYIKKWGTNKLVAFCLDKITEHKQIVKYIKYMEQSCQAFMIILLMCLLDVVEVLNIDFPINIQHDNDGIDDMRKTILLLLDKIFH